MKRMMMAAVVAGVLAVGGFSAAHAQFGGLGNIVRNAVAPALPNVLAGDPPISTSIKDATFGDPNHDSFQPPAAQALTSLQRAEKGGFKLAPGYYTMLAQSYCLHAGTHGPSQGDGYLYAPVKGSAREAVITILQNSNDHPEIAQRDIQLLLWAIVARAKFEDLDTNLKFVASQLLSTKQLATLNRSALSVLSSPELSRLTGGLPGPLRTVVEAESQMRSMFSGGPVNYGQMETLAVLAGVAPMGEGSVDVPSTRWSKHPDGYWVRYRPNGYSNTNVEIYVEQGSKAVGKVYDPALAIAAPGNTARQRLAQSARVYGG